MGDSRVLCWNIAIALRALTRACAWTLGLAAGAVALILALAGSAEASGPVVGWGAGADSNGKATPPAAVDGTAGRASAIGAGGNFSCAIQAGTGKVVCWGDDTNGELSVPASVDGTSGTASALATGDFHSCAIQTGTGAVVCWGGDNIEQASPPAAVNGTSGTASAISGGGYHSCAIQAGTGKVVCWGRNAGGESSPPAAVNGTSGTASAIASGGYYSCAIQAGTGAVVCWGEDNIEQASPPAAVNGTSGTAIAIAAGWAHGCAIQAGTNAVICWGYNTERQTSTPASVDGTEGTASAIAAGSDHSCAIQSGTDEVVCWGSDTGSENLMVKGLGRSKDSLEIVIAFEEGFFTFVTDQGTAGSGSYQSRREGRRLVFTLDADAQEPVTDVIEQWIEGMAAFEGIDVSASADVQRISLKGRLNRDGSELTLRGLVKGRGTDLLTDKSAGFIYSFRVVGPVAAANP